MRAIASSSFTSNLAFFILALLSRPFVMATKGEISEQSEAVQALFDYINSGKGQEIIAKVGLISAK